MTRDLVISTDVDIVPTVFTGGTMQDARRMIVTRIEKLGWTNYRFAKECQDHKSSQISRAQAYEFIKGQRDVTAENLMIMFEVVGLEVVEAGAGKKPRKRKAK